MEPKIRQADSPTTASPVIDDGVLPLISIPKDPTRVLNINVGVLGHVDSGKTSLVKRLSSLLSTAALDKHPQSRERGITLDLGFSAFFIHPPASMKWEGKYDCIQITLVDCPGHGSLIRTVIGGAQIIDMILLVIDATKGIQAQTTECLVIAEITTDNLIVVLNKIDLFPADVAQERIEQVKKTVRNALSHTKFRSAHVPMVPISAAVGGEKVAAANSASSFAESRLPSTNIDELLRVLNDHITLPKRADRGGGDVPAHSFHFAIDHCFPIKGKGTVITGTVLHGSTQVQDTIYFPEYNIERKVKSIQMFKRPTSKVRQGDRCGICVASLDSTLIERGVATSKPSAGYSYIQCFDAAICIVQKVKAYQGGHLLSDSKFHISVGHTTVMAIVKFLGAQEILSSFPVEQQRTLSSFTTFNFDQDYLYQDRLIESSHFLKKRTKSILNDNKNQKELEEFFSSAKFDENHDYGNTCDDSPIFNWAIVHFQTPVFCPLHSLMIGSRLDTDAANITNTMADLITSTNQNYSNSTCRLAFHGRIIQKFDPKLDSARLKIYKWKEKRGTIQRLGDAYKRDIDQKIIRYEVFGGDLFKKETKMSQFVGMKIITEDEGDIGVIRSSFGTEGRFKVHFPAGTEAKEGTKLILRFKRYTSDPKKGMHQDMLLPDALYGTKIETVKKSKVKKDRKNKVAPSSSRSSDITEKSSNNAANFSNVTNEYVALDKSDVSTTTSQQSAALHQQLSTTSIVAQGVISKYKQDSVMSDGQRYTAVIVDGFFSPEINIKEKVGMRVIVVDTNEEGIVSGSFGKMGKCKVVFEQGISVPEGSKVVLLG